MVARWKKRFAFIYSPAKASLHINIPLSDFTELKMFYTIELDSGIISDIFI